MKKLLPIFILSCIFICLYSCSTPQYYYGIMANVKVTKKIDPRKTTIAVLPCKSTGNPNEKISWDVTEKFEEYLRGNVGFNVIERIWVEQKINDLKLDINNLSLNDMKVIKKELRCDYLFLSNIIMHYVSGSSSSYGYGRAKGSNANVQSGSYSTEGYYSPISESISLIDPISQETILTGRIESKDIPDASWINKSMSWELSWAIYRYLYNVWPKI